jgi:hypothetical protein
VQGALRRFHGIRSQRAKGSASDALPDLHVGAGFSGFTRGCHGTCTLYQVFLLCFASVFVFIIGQHEVTFVYFVVCLLFWFVSCFVVLAAWLCMSLPLGPLHEP